MVNPVIVLKTDQSFKTRQKLNMANFSKKKILYVLVVNFILFFKKEKLDPRLSFREFFLRFCFFKVLIFKKCWFFFKVLLF